MAKFYTAALFEMSLEKYKLVSDTKADFDNLNVAALWTTRDSRQKTYHELRITQKGKPKNYIADALQLFKQGSKKVMLRALGRAISKAITIAEVLKRKLALHQRTHLSSFKVVDVYEPLEEGLDRVENVRYISSIEILLSLDTDDIDIHDMGYQPPICAGQDPSLLTSDFNSKLHLKSP